MSQTIAVPTRASAPQAASRRTNPDRRFYLIVAIAMLIFTATGFREFFLHGKALGGDITAQILPLVVVHGIAMFSWVVVFFLQTFLIQTGRRKLHLVLGPFAVLLAAAIVILGSVVAGLSVHINPAQYAAFGGAKAFLATMWIQMILFGTFVALGWFYRRKPAIHRPMMLLGTVVMQSGALSRFPYIEDLALHGPLYVWIPVLIFGALLFLLQWALNRTANRAYLIGYAGITLAAFLSVIVGNSSLWSRLTASIIP